MNQKILARINCRGGIKNFRHFCLYFVKTGYRFIKQSRITKKLQRRISYVYRSLCVCMEASELCICQRFLKYTSLLVFPTSLDIIRIRQSLIDPAQKSRLVLELGLQTKRLSLSVTSTTNQVVIRL